MGPHVGACVEDEAVAQAEELSVVAERDRNLVHLLARVVGSTQVLLTVSGPADRPAKAQGTERDQEVLGVDLAAGAEAAADVELDQAHPLLREAQHPGEDAVG